MTASKIIPFPSHARPRLVADATAAAHVAGSPEMSPSVTFRRSFVLPGMDVPHAPGTFEVRRTREPLNVMGEAYLITTRIMLSAPGSIEAHEVTSADLEAALALDLAPET